MINSQSIEDKWHSINVPKIAEYQFVGLSKECEPSLNVGFNSQGKRCLILELPLDYTIDINSVAKENLSIEHLQEKNYVVIQLINDAYYDLFNDLILSLFQKIKDISSVEEYANEFVISFGKWVEFFENKRGSRLSPEEIKGLYGEIFVLNGLLNSSNSSGINDILNGWVGLYNTRYDFQFQFKNIEVKTKEESKSYVYISSEYQLESETGKELELHVVSVMIDYEKGKSIYDLLKITVGFIREKLGDLSILYKALNEKKLTIESTKEYNNYRFSVLKKTSFNCGHDDFPKLTYSNTPAEISKLKYVLKVTDLNEFLIEEINY